MPASIRAAASSRLTFQDAPGRSSGIGDNQINWRGVIKGQ
jgi:hypothetical protein